MATIPPVLIIIFNRPDIVRNLIDSLSQVKPSLIYIAADGPRPDVPGEAERCLAARTVAQNIPWPCTVKTLFSEVNQGVDPAVEAAISWFFENEPEGIILEDDCIPHPDFFTFTSEMLERYRSDERVMMVSGNNFQKERIRGDGSYYFSNYGNTWGWATWKRAWEKYDTALAALPGFIEHNSLATILPRVEEQRFWIKYLRKLHAGTRTAWDTKWLFAQWLNNGVAIVPNTNLVENIGFGSDATHTVGDTSRSVDANSFPPPYRTPSSGDVHNEADRYLFDTVFRVTFMQKVRYILSILHGKARSISPTSSKTAPY
ncbi:MAG: hypothetical protein ABIT47_00445 [Candidatus Paceibacterota bacterium]